MLGLNGLLDVKLCLEVGWVSGDKFSLRSAGILCVCARMRGCTRLYGVHE